MAKRYEVTGACITHIPVSTSQGSMLTTLYRGAALPSDVPAKLVKHLLDSNLIAEVKDDAPAEPEQQDETPEVPAVNSRSSKQDLVAHGVARGDGTSEELDALTRDQLLDRYVRPQQ